MKREQTQTRDKTSQLQQWDIWKSSPRVNSRALCCSSGSRGQQRPNICAAGSWFHILNIHLAAVSLDPVSEHTVYVQCWTLQGKQVWAGHTCWVRPCSQRKLISADFRQPLCELLEGLSVWVNDVFEHRAGDGSDGWNACCTRSDVTTSDCHRSELWPAAGSYHGSSAFCPLSHLPNIFIQWLGIPEFDSRKKKSISAKAPLPNWSNESKTHVE